MGGFGASLCLWSLPTDCEYSTLEEPRTCRTVGPAVQAGHVDGGRAAHVQDSPFRRTKKGSEASEKPRARAGQAKPRPEKYQDEGSPAHGQNAAWAQRGVSA